jgi:cytochrome c oxidase subunit 1
MTDDHAHHDVGFIRKYVFSVDHKVIGVQYTVTSLIFLFFGFTLMMIMRWQLAYPGEAIPWIGTWLGSALEGLADKETGVLLPEGYNALGAMHGTIMVFLGVVPLAVGGFGNYVMPLQIGAPDMAFPKLNMLSYWIYLPGGLLMLSSFLMPGGAANSGWTAYPPLSNIATTGQTVWLLAMVLLITSSLLGSVNFIVTILHLRVNGLTMFRLPFFVWAQFVTSFLLLLAFPPLEAAGVMQLMDRLLDTSFFMPSGLVVSGVAQDQALGGPYSGGGSPLLWQHLFWFLAHPEVYVLILPAIGIVGEVIANNTRKPLWGYRTLVYSIIFLGFMSFIVWAHHMFLTGMGTSLSWFFQTTTMIISVPSVVVLTALLLSLYNASIRFTVPMLFALAFLPMFAIGGLTGLPLGSGGFRHPPARHLLRHWAFPLRGRAGNDHGPLRRGVLLVSQGHRPADEQLPRQVALLAHVHLHERGVHAHVLRGAFGDFAALVGSDQLLPGQRNAQLGEDVVVGGVDAGRRPAPLHHQFLLERVRRSQDDRQPVGSHHAGMGCPFAAAAREFPRGAGGLSRTV